MNDFRIFFRPSSVRLLTLLALFFICLAAVSVIQALVFSADMGDRSALLLMSGIQALIAFVLPAVIAARLFDKNSCRYLSLDNAGSARAYLGVVFLFIVALPFLNQTVYYNANVHFPESIEGTLRALEEQALATTETLLGDKSVWGLFSGIIVVGVVTGFAEELFFRGALQKIFLGMMPAAAAITLSALIFSALHMQFYGFIPRLLMGLAFGYLCWKSGSVYVSAGAHILNNSLVVLTSWLVARGSLPGDADTIGVVESGFPWIPLISCLATAGVLASGGNYLFGKAEKNVRKQSSSE